MNEARQVSRISGEEHAASRNTMGLLVPTDPGEELHVSEDHSKRRHRYHYPLILAGLTVLFSVVSHSLTRPEQDSVVITRLFTGDDAFVQQRTSYAWHFFQRGVVFGDANVTPFGKFLYRSLGTPFGTFRVLDPTNPTPFMLFALCLLTAAFLARREQKAIDE